MQGRYRAVSDCPPITQFRTGTEKALDPPPVGAFSFWSPFSSRSAMAQLVEGA